MNVPSKEKYLYFMEQSDGLFNTANDMVCYPVSKLVGFTNPGTDVGQLRLSFLPLNESSGGTDHDQVILSVTDNTQKEAIADILNEIAFGNSVRIVVADVASSTFLGSNIIGVDSITVTAAS